MNKNIFEAAVRGKYRFPYKGMISVEDLWDLPLPALDSIFKTLNKQAKQAQEESLLDTKSKEDEALENKIELIRYIVSVKKQEAGEIAMAKKKKSEKEKMMAILEDKRDEAFKNMPIDELEKRIADMMNE